MIEDPHVGLGHLMIAIAEPHRDGLEAYHRWFEREHMYAAVLIGPGAFAGERYVASPAMKSLRYPPDGGVFPSLRVGSFVALYYLVDGSVDEHFAWSYAQTARLDAAGRTNRDRDLVLTWLCDLHGHVPRGRDSVPPEIALDHHYAGLVMLWLEAENVSARDALADWIVQKTLPELLEGSAIDQVQLFRPRDFPAPPEDLPITPGSIAPNAWRDRGLLLLCFLDASPEVVWDPGFARLGERIAKSGLGQLRLAAPFRPTDRGRRTDPDAIW